MVQVTFNAGALTSDTSGIRSPGELILDTRGEGGPARSVKMGPVAGRSYVPGSRQVLLFLVRGSEEA